MKRNQHHHECRMNERASRLTNGDALNMRRSRRPTCKADDHHNSSTLCVNNLQELMAGWTTYITPMSATEASKNWEVAHTSMTTRNVPQCSATRSNRFEHPRKLLQCSWFSGYCCTVLGGRNSHDEVHATVTEETVY